MLSAPKTDRSEEQFQPELYFARGALRTTDEPELGIASRKRLAIPCVRTCHAYVIECVEEFGPELERLLFSVQRKVLERAYIPVTEPW